MILSLEIQCLRPGYLELAIDFSVLLLFSLFFYASFVVFFFNMGGSVFFFVESKTFEFSVEEGGSYFLLRIFERGLTSMCSVFMGKESANRFLFHLEELISKQSPGHFARTIREGDIVFILQLGSNAYGKFLMVSELLHGQRKGNMVIPEGRLGSGWCGFGLNLRKILKPASLTGQVSFHRIQSAPKAEVAVVVDRPYNHGGAKNKGKATTGIPKRDALISYVLVVAGKWKKIRGGGVEGKNKSALVGVKILSDFSRNTCKKSILGPREQLGPKFLSDLSHNNRDTCKVSTLGQRELLGAKVLSTIKGIESDGIKSELSLDLFMRMEHGIDGRWAIVWSEVNEVGPKVQQPIKPTGHNSIPSSPFNTAKPTAHNFIPSSPFNTAKPKFVWRPRQSQTLVNPAHCQSLKSELVAQVLGSQV